MLQRFPPATASSHQLGKQQKLSMPNIEKRVRILESARPAIEEYRYAVDNYARWFLGGLLIALALGGLSFLLILTGHS